MVYSYNMDIANFFDRRKKISADNSSVDEAAAKKQYEESLNDSMGLDKDGVFCTNLKVSRMC